MEIKWNMLTPNGNISSKSNYFHGREVDNQYKCEDALSECFDGSRWDAERVKSLAQRYGLYNRCSAFDFAVLRNTEDSFVARTDKNGTRIKIAPATDKARKSLRWRIIAPSGVMESKSNYLRGADVDRQYRFEDALAKCFGGKRWDAARIESLVRQYGLYNRCSSFEFSQLRNTEKSFIARTDRNGTRINVTFD